MRTVLDAPRLHDTDRPGYWTVTTGGIACGTVYQRGNGLHFNAVTPAGESQHHDTREQAADWLAAQEVGR